MKDLNFLKSGQKSLKKLSLNARNSILFSLTEELKKNRSHIEAANAVDLSQNTELSDLRGGASFKERLKFGHKQIEGAIGSVLVMSNLPDPIGNRVRQSTRPDGLKICQEFTPIGTILVIFESRPNVAIDAFCLAIKSGNALILRGGSEASHTLHALYSIFYRVLKESQYFIEALPFEGIEDYDRKVINLLLKKNEIVDLVIPRGGPGLIEHVSQNTTIPILKNDRGLCHVYVHEKADIQWAIKIVENAKCHRPGVCNAMETLLIDRALASRFLSELIVKLKPYPLKWVCCQESYEILQKFGIQNIEIAVPGSWDIEYLDFVLNCRIVRDLADAIAHIEDHGSGHSEAIVTMDQKVATQFIQEVDCASVLINASTRFTDGGELGLGAEIGISTQKIHARGPIGLEELTVKRWIIEGQGHVR